MDQRFLALTRGAYQSREELAWVWREHLIPRRPRHIIEIGVAAGGTTRLFLEVAGAEGLVLGIDVDDRDLAADVRAHPRFRLLLGPSASAAIVEQAKALMPACDLLLIDGDHSEAGVLADTAAYLPLVRPGGLVLWHDVQLESPSGIKRVWYRALKPHLAGATEHLVDPFNTGFGLWEKDRDVDLDPAMILRSGSVGATPPPSVDGTIRLANDPGALRAEVSAAILAALDTPTTAGDARDQLVHEVAPKTAASFVRLQKWDEGRRFVEAVVSRAPAFAVHALKALDAGLRGANRHGVTDPKLPERTSETFLSTVAHVPDDDLAANLSVRLVRTLRQWRRVDLAIELARAALARAPESRDLRLGLAAALLERATPADEQSHSEARGLLAALQREAPEDPEVAFWFIGAGAGEEARRAGAKALLRDLAKQARTPLHADDVTLGAHLPRRLDRFGFAQIQ
ncbi:MAG TPA: class I SAM-dependent methyltransferase, partial [Polyangia bacterium]